MVILGGTILGGNNFYESKQKGKIIMKDSLDKNDAIEFIIKYAKDSDEKLKLLKEMQDEWRATGFTYGYLLEQIDRLKQCQNKT